MVERWFPTLNKAMAARRGGERIIHGTATRPARGFGLTRREYLTRSGYDVYCDRCGGWQSDGDALDCDCAR